MTIPRIFDEETATVRKSSQSLNAPPFSVNYTCLRTHRRHPRTHLLYIPHENIKIGCLSLAIYQILSNFTTQK